MAKTAKSRPTSLRDLPHGEFDVLHRKIVQAKSLAILLGYGFDHAEDEAVNFTHCVLVELLEDADEIMTASLRRPTPTPHDGNGLGATDGMTEFEERGA